MSAFEKHILLLMVPQTPSNEPWEVQRIVLPCEFEQVAVCEKVQRARCSQVASEFAVLRPQLSRKCWLLILTPSTPL